MTWSFALAVVLAVSDAPLPPEKAAQEGLQTLHRETAADWQMAIGDEGTDKAELEPAPIYVWTNPTKSTGQYGTLFVWKWQDRPVVIGTVFSHPEKGRRLVCQEFHSLCPERLLPRRGAGGESWKPQAVVKLQPLPDAPVPEDSPSRRLIQMRAFGRELSAHSIDFGKQRWELRVLTQPLYRYKQVDGEVVDGALFAFVTSAGTDPEVILALEARRTPEATAWFYRLLRFSDSDLYVERDGREIWSSVRDHRNQFYFNPDHTYRLIRDTLIDELPELKQ